jgi:S-adenosylmethionine-diacylgycerolhomoserine-N-methlytransferase
VLLAGRHELVSFYGVDASSAMLGTARAVLARRGLGERVRLERGLAEAFDRRALFGLDEPFDDVLFSYALSMIGPWRAALDRALAALRPGGTLHVVDFGAAEGLPPLLRRAMRVWLSLWGVDQRADAPGHLAALAARGRGELGCRRMLGGYAYRLTFRTVAPGRAYPTPPPELAAVGGR